MLIYSFLGRGCYQSSWLNKWNGPWEEWADSKSSICKKHTGAWIRGVRNFTIKQSCSCSYWGCNIFPTGVLFFFHIVEIVGF